MQLLKKLLTNGLMFFGLSFAIIMSATAIGSETTRAIAEQGNADAQYELGWDYIRAVAARENYNTSFEWFLRAANQGHAEAQFNLGTIYQRGLGVRQDHTKAIQWFKKSNSSHSQLELGEIYEYGKGVKQDKDVAKEWYGRSCDNGAQNGCDSYRILKEQGYQ